ncbi:acetamidase/formamidase family protein [Sulfobacillus sp. hq2]|uniref:acetamidase/formamidase family protein n=1 Tax=Sulfobacillus TaxID=28033 RepID=UPI000CD22E82|nr:acetamidase/formamidase family protein [Sulfobacillus sp. hq2]POB10221.1 acetamidase [Sulfobacillus sp. hq2]
MTTHYFPDQVHFRWDQHLAPVLTIASGDTVVYDLRDVTDGQINPQSSDAILTELDWDRVYALAGPLGIEGAEPGDTLEIEMLDLHTRGWGWTGTIPGFGLLPQDFPDAHLHIWDISNGRVARFQDVASIPLRPFCGTMGVTPATSEPTLIMPPGHFGGNVDCRDLITGTRLYLPVQVPKALFSVGDPHAAQGDGEVCVSALECPMTTAFRFILHKGYSIPGPQFQTSGPLRSGIEDQGYYATMGVGPDLMAAAQDAVRAMVDYISHNYRLDPLDAYILSSVVVDLKISEVVDQPNWVVSAYLPLSIFH